MKRVLYHTIVTIICCSLVLPAWAQTWTDISTTLVQAKGMTFPGGIANCSGVCVNRLNGDVVVKFIDNGIWKSADKGTTWARIDNNTTGGRCESGWALQTDQNNPARIASFSLDGTSGYTTDGTTWKKINSSSAAGRGFDFGSVDWATTDAKVMLASAHESNGKISMSTDGGTTWSILSVTFNNSNPNSGTTSMLGVMDANTFIYSSGSGIQRSTDLGATWTKVSTANPQTRVAVLFKGKQYLGTATGLLVSIDKGATWQTQGTSMNFYQGPFFGADENTMVVVGTQGFYRTADAGSTWTKLAGIPPACQYSFDANWFGGYSWDPVNNTAYATRMVCPAVKYQLSPTPVGPGTHRETFHRGLSSNIRTLKVPGNRLAAEALRGFSGSTIDIYNVVGIFLARVRVNSNGTVAVGRNVSEQQIVFVRAR
jgi:hypothetical protein